MNMRRRLISLLLSALLCGASTSFAADPRKLALNEIPTSHLHCRHAGHLPWVAAALRAMKQEGFYQRAACEKLPPALNGGSR